MLKLFDCVFVNMADLKFEKSFTLHVPCVALRYSGIACAAFSISILVRYQLTCSKVLNLQWLTLLKRTNSVNNVSFNLMSCQDTLLTSDAKVVHH